MSVPSERRTASRDSIVGMGGGFSDAESLRRMKYTPSRGASVGNSGDVEHLERNQWALPHIEAGAQRCARGRRRHVPEWSRFLTLLHALGRLELENALLAREELIDDTSLEGTVA